MKNRLDEIENRYNFLSQELMKQENIKDLSKYKELSKEQKNIEEIVNSHKEYKKILEDIKLTKEMLEDKELFEFAKEELKPLEIKKEEKEKELELLLIPKDEDDDKNVIVEIRGAAGGDEANIFAGNLFEMYSRYCENMNWKIEIVNEIRGSSGGYSQIEFMIKGKNVYSKLKFESGTHRVQRVPGTETQGRVHTSTATVIVMPEREDIDVDIKEQELRIDVYRSSGAGGQSVNTTDSAVRITHIPTNIVVTCQNERSQIKNREQALTILKNKLYERYLEEQSTKEGEMRKSKIGFGDRSEKIRTYNYPQNRVTDHRINFSLMELDRVMLGKLGILIQELTQEDLKRKISNGC